MPVEAVISDTAKSVGRETLSRVVGKDCSIDLLIDDLVEELRERHTNGCRLPAAGSQTCSRYAASIRALAAPTRGAATMLSEFEAMVPISVGYFQPVTCAELSEIFGKEVSRDTIGNLRGAGFIGSGPRSPTPGAPYTYVTTPHFLSSFCIDTLRDLPNIEALEDGGLLNRLAVQNEIAASEGGESETEEASFIECPAVYSRLATGSKSISMAVAESTRSGFAFSSHGGSRTCFGARQRVLSTISQR